MKSRLMVILIIAAGILATIVTLWTYLDSERSQRKVEEANAKLVESQQALIEKQEKINQLQANLYLQIVGGNTIDKTFTIPVVIDSKDHLPILFQYSPGTWKNRRVESFVNLARPFAEINGKLVAIGTPPVDSNESIVFIGQMLQYKIFTDLADIQNVQWTLTHSKKGIDEASKGSLSVKEPFRLSESEEIEKERILDIFSNRIFPQSNSEKNRWDFGVGLRVPKATKVYLDSMSVHDKKQKITLDNAGNFSIEFTIEWLGSASSIPKDALIADKELAKRCETYFFKVRLNAIFHNMETGNPQAVEYKKWAEWLFEELRTKNSD